MNTVYEFGDGRKTAMPSDDLIDVDIDDYYGGDEGPDPDSQSGHAESDLPDEVEPDADNAGNKPAFSESGWTARRKRSSRKQASVPTLTYLSDPGHGWLGVPIDLFPDAPSFSTGYSYYDSKTNTIWLEEDQEAPAFKRAHEGEFGIVEKNEPFDDAWVRSLPVMQITPVASRSNKGNAVSKLSPSEAARLRKFRATVQRNAPKVATEMWHERGQTADGITVYRTQSGSITEPTYADEDGQLHSIRYYDYTINDAIDAFREGFELPVPAGEPYITMQFGSSKRSRGSRKTAGYADDILIPFYDYVMGVYGTGGVFDMGATYEQVQAATEELLTSGVGWVAMPDGKYVQNTAPFEGDSVDRESVRYYLETMFGLSEKTAVRRRGSRKTALPDYKCSQCGDITKSNFPGDLCLACWEKSPESQRMVSAEELVSMWGGPVRRSASRRPAGKAASRRRATRKTAYGDGLDVRMLMVDLDRSDIRDYIEEQEISGFNASSYKSALVDFVLSKATSNEDAIKRANAALNDMALVGYDSANEIQAEVYDYLKENGIDDDWDRLRGEWKAHLRQARTASRQGGRRPFVPSRNDIRRRGTLKTGRVSGAQLDELSKRVEALGKRFEEERVWNSAYLLMVEGRILTQMSIIAQDASLRDAGGRDFPFAIYNAMLKFQRLHPRDEDGAESSLYEYAMKAVGVLERNFDTLVESARGERADSWSTMGKRRRGKRKTAATYEEGVEDGRAAFHAGKPGASALDEVARQKLVGQPGESLSYLEGWSKGWMEENLKAPVTARRRKTAMPSPEETGVKVGDFFVHSWGYEQTNTDFYEVVGLTGASVKVRQTQKEVVSGHDTTSEMVVPIPSSSYGRGGVMTKRLKVIEYGSGPRVVIRINDFTRYASLWDGTPKRQTGANWGH